MIEPSSLFWAYFAGFFDGEGSFSWRGSTSPFLSVAQSGPEGMAVLSEFVYGLKKCELKGTIRVRSYKKGRFKEVHVVCLNNRETIVFVMKHIFPYLRVKKVLIQDALRYFALYPRLTSKVTFAFTRGDPSTVCKNGHLFSDGGAWLNHRKLTRWGKPTRYCKICLNAANKRGREKRRV